MILVPEVQPIIMMPVPRRWNVDGGTVAIVPSSVSQEEGLLQCSVGY